ncbi:ectonucleoside triphosphate diphosphohydrolase 8 isoform X2 [Ochotona princeps]|uniref:ectonucleoside triphosphate diphosphohydrolase 8 isoform X2 n=1 Tax=Ochotona princeps TaxID=9978 RepID=UPI0027147F01|nr:ectonucleoside triphosphate diphosphohydrolase 8 isoform X2 [Ochotona princeps]
MGPREQTFTALLAVAAVAGLTTLILLLVDATSVLLPTTTKFGAVLDAGSSHTSLFLYQWPADKENNTGVVSQALACRAQGPGISSYAANPMGAAESLRDCLEEAVAHIPQAQHGETPLFLGATAGMRLLSQKNSSQAAEVFDAVSRVLAHSPLDFRGAELLSGRDEGAFGWITANYLLGRLVKYSPVGKWIRPVEEALVGALDLGGASTQISFVPEGPVLDARSQATFRLYGTTHSLYAHSHLCFGRDQALLRLLVGLLQGNLTGPVRHPCYHSGYRATLAPGVLYESPCVRDPAIPGLPQNLTVEGTGNPAACVAAIRTLFNFSSCVGRADCAFDGVYQPPVRGPFYAFSSFYHTFHFLNLTAGQTLDMANATVWAFCQRSWKLVEDSYPGQGYWLRDYCASGLYVLTLLLDGFGFSQETWASIQFRAQADGTDLGWTLGYMLNLTGLLPADAPAQWRAQHPGVWVAGVVFTVLTLVAILGAFAVQLFWPQD